MSKLYIITKTGYTAGVNGCTGEYFSVQIINGDDFAAYRFQGLFGAEQRVERALRDRGYKGYWMSSNYGQLKRRDLLDTMSERDMVAEIEGRF